jgi:hypothetical protein
MKPKLSMCFIYVGSINHIMTLIFLGMGHCVCIVYSIHADGSEILVSLL